tara:strand:+ start:114 stop:404 length:291 start_codon:yes stop_codon:yes gene_type:complete
MVAQRVLLINRETGIVENAILLDPMVQVELPLEVYSLPSPNKGDVGDTYDRRSKTFTPPPPEPPDPISEVGLLRGEMDKLSLKVDMLIDTAGMRGE